MTKESALKMLADILNDYCSLYRLPKNEIDEINNMEIFISAHLKD